MTINAEKLIELSSYFTIIHHIKGRIRVRVNPKIKECGKEISIEEVENLPQKIEGIKSVKINKVVASMTIEYDAEIFPPYLWDNLIAQNALDEIVPIINRLIKEFT